VHSFLRIGVVKYLPTFIIADCLCTSTRAFTRWLIDFGAAILAAISTE
jgi:hypothetical protein